jgi:hypothetical protein
MDRRKMVRFNLQLPTGVSLLGELTGQKRVQLLTKNICSDGAFFETKKPFPLGTKLAMEILLDSKEVKKAEMGMAFVRVNGSVIRSQEKGMAICFDEDYQILPVPS